ncbi:unnamed protein product [Ophioblennius macclurei]
MAPTAVNVERQTNLIIKCLFDDAVDFRQLDDGLEVDGPADEDDDFDPALVADKLRRIGDALVEDPRFSAALSDLKKAAAQEGMEAAFGHSVDVLRKTQPHLSAEVIPEMQLIRASVAIGLYVKKSVPELISKVQSVMGPFLNRQVGSWIAEQGGWDRVMGELV